MPNHAQIILASLDRANIEHSVTKTDNYPAGKNLVLTVRIASEPHSLFPEMVAAAYRMFKKSNALDDDSAAKLGFKKDLIRTTREDKIDALYFDFDFRAVALLTEETAQRFSALINGGTGMIRMIRSAVNQNFTPESPAPGTLASDKLRQSRHWAPAFAR